MFLATRAFLIGIGTEWGSWSLKILKAAARASLLFGVMGLLYCAFLSSRNPQINSDTLALSVIVLLASFWLWSKSIFWIAHRFKKADEASVEEAAFVYKALNGTCIYMFLFVIPTLLIAGIAMRLLQLNDSASVAFLILKNASFFSVALIIFGVLRGIFSGAGTLSVSFSTIERVGKRSSLSPVGMVAGLWSTTVRQL